MSPNCESNSETAADRAPMHELLHHTVGVLAAIPTWIAPLIFLPLARAQLARKGSRVWRAWLGTVAAFVVYSVAAWYLLPERSGTSLAVLAGGTIFLAPPAGAPRPVAAGTPRRPPAHAPP